jgi:hypothetical protein
VVFSLSSLCFDRGNSLLTRSDDYFSVDPEARVGNRRAPVATHVAYQLLEILSHAEFVNGDAAINNGDGKTTRDCNEL